MIEYFFSLKCLKIGDNNTIQNIIHIFYIARNLFNLENNLLRTSNNLSL